MMAVMGIGGCWLWEGQVLQQREIVRGKQQLVMKWGGQEGY